MSRQCCTGIMHANFANKFPENNEKQKTKAVQKCIWIVYVYLEVNLQFLTFPELHPSSAKDLKHFNSMVLYLDVMYIDLWLFRATLTMNLSQNSLVYYWQTNSSNKDLQSFGAFN